jgi:hypothetical protein
LIWWIAVNAQSFVEFFEKIFFAGIDEEECEHKEK